MIRNNSYQVLSDYGLAYVLCIQEDMRNFNSFACQESRIRTQVPLTLRPRMLLQTVSHCLLQVIKDYRTMGGGGED